MKFLQKKAEDRKREQDLVRKKMIEVQTACQNDTRLAQRIKYAEYLANCPIEKKHILYEAYSGRSISCSPYAIFKYLLSHRQFKNYVHIWVLGDFEDNTQMMLQYAGFENVKFVCRQSDEYLRYLATAEYLINNATFPAFFAKRKGQIYVNTWHGTPLKKMGYDIPGGRKGAGNVIRNFLLADYLISGNSVLTDMYRNAYKLDGIYEGEILEEGMPRSDSYFRADRAEVIQKLRECGVDIDPDKKIILYAPTWKGENFGKPNLDLRECFEAVESIRRHVDLDQYQILVKLHQIIYKYAKLQGGEFIPATMDTNELFAAVDVLITDYSSIFFDFLVTGRPILFYLPDLESYSDYRGVYFDVKELPGPIAANPEELGELVKELPETAKLCSEKYQRIRKLVCAKDDGRVCERIVGRIFQNRPSQGKIKCDRCDKIKLLFYGGVLVTNGIEHSFMTLLQQIDYEKFDVTVITRKGKDRLAEERIEHLPKEVRVLYHDISVSATAEEYARHQLIMEHGLDAGVRAPAAMYEREIRRMTGHAKFDYVIEFTGYSTYFSVLFSFFPGAKKLIWMHNNLKREIERGNQGGRDVGAALRVCFSAYPYMDWIVGCSKSVMEINRKNLGTEKTQKKFTYARNLVSYDRIIHEPKEPFYQQSDRDAYYIRQPAEGNPISVEIEALRMPRQDKVNFVTIGRLSPEKNQENLILAFAKLYRERPDIRLYILGEGMLREQLEAVVEKEGLEGIVNLVGILQAPFQFMKSCQCFILPSNYEGQPLVIQEARVLKLPIIVAEFDSVKDVLTENGQLLIGQDTDSIYEGMKSFLDGKVPAYEFDPRAYNREVYREFEKLFDVRGVK